MKKLLLAGAAILALTTASQAALISNLGVDPNLNIGNTPGAGFFSDQYTFTLSSNQTITIVAILNTYPQGPNTSAFITGFVGSVFEVGNPVPVIGPTFASAPCGPLINCQSLGGQATLGAGAYFLNFEGTAGSTAAYGGSVNTVAVPGPTVGSFNLAGIINLFR